METEHGEASEAPATERAGHRYAEPKTTAPHLDSTTLDAGLWPGWFPTMARLARVIAPGMPHHVTQRGKPRQETFFGEEDYQHYLKLMAQFCRAEQVAIWAYCLTPTADPTACA